MIDMNNNGIADSGDLHPAIPSMITGGGNITGNNLTLSSASAIARVSTMHSFYGGSESYGLDLQINDNAESVIAVTLVSGPNVAVPLDIGKDNYGSFQTSQWLNSTSPTVGDSYGFKVTFSDGTTRNISGSVTAVLNPPQNLVAQTTAPGTPTVPLFTWAAPVSPPASYTYGLYLWEGASWWYQFFLPSTTTSVLYNADGMAFSPALTPGTPYTWSVYVYDANLNMAMVYSTYTP